MAVFYLTLTYAGLSASHIAHSVFSIYSYGLRYLLFPNYITIIVILVRYALSTHRDHRRALSTPRKSLSTLKFLDTPDLCEFDLEL